MTCAGLIQVKPSTCRACTLNGISSDRAPMCELFAMSARFPADVRFSLEAFSRRGGLAGRHKDGWGIAYYVDEDVRLVKEPQPAVGSACLHFIQDHPFSAARACISSRTTRSPPRPSSAISGARREARRR